MLATEKMHMAMDRLEEALKELDLDNKRSAIGSLDYVEDYIQAAKHILIAEVKERDGKF